MSDHDDGDRQKFEQAVDAWRRQHPEAQEIPSNVIWKIIKELGYRKSRPKDNPRRSGTGWAYEQLPE